MPRNWMINSFRRYGRHDYLELWSGECLGQRRNDFGLLWTFSARILYYHLQVESDFNVLYIDRLMLSPQWWTIYSNLGNAALLRVLQDNSLVVRMRATEMFPEFGSTNTGMNIIYIWAWILKRPKRAKDESYHIELPRKQNGVFELSSSSRLRKVVDEV